MAYCTSQEIAGAVGGNEKLAWITDLDAVAINQTAVTSAIEYATATIDQYAAGTKDVTGTPGAMWESTPIQAKQTAINIAVYALYDRIRGEIPESWKKAFEYSMSLLEKLAAGKVSWVVSSPPPVHNTSKVYYFGPGSTAREDNPRRTLRSDFDKF